MAFLSAGTDGTDGHTSAAGGIVDGRSVTELMESKVDVEESLRRFDSFRALALWAEVRHSWHRLAGTYDTNIYSGDRLTPA